MKKRRDDKRVILRQEKIQKKKISKSNPSQESGGLISIYKRRRVGKRKKKIRQKHLSWKFNTSVPEEIIPSGEENKFLRAKRAWTFVDFGGQLLKVKIIDSGGHNYPEIKVVDERELPWANILEDAFRAVPSVSLSVFQKK